MFKITDVDVKSNIVSVLDTSDGVVEGIPAFDLLSILAGGQFTFEGATFVKDTTSVAIELNGDKYTVKLSSANTAYIEKEIEEGVSEGEDSSMSDEGVVLTVEATTEEPAVVNNSVAESEVDTVGDKEAHEEDEEETSTVISAESTSALESTYISAVKGESVSAEDIVRSAESADVISTEDGSENTEDATDALIAIYNKFDAESEDIEDGSENTEDAVDSLLDKYVKLGDESEDTEGTADELVDMYNKFDDESSGVSAEETSQMPCTESTACETECAEDTLSSLASRYNLDTSEEVEVHEENDSEKESGATPIEVDTGSVEQEVESVEVNTGAVEHEVESVEKATNQGVESAQVSSPTIKKNVISKIGKSQSKKFKVNGKQYVCLLKISGVSDFENAFFVFGKTCSDFVYFCGSDVKLFLPDKCVSNIPLKDKTLQCVDKMLKGRIKNSEGMDISLFDVCTGKDKSIQIYRPFSDELSSSSDDEDFAIIGVSILEA